MISNILSHFALVLHRIYQQLLYHLEYDKYKSNKSPLLYIIFYKTVLCFRNLLQYFIILYCMIIIITRPYDILQVKNFFKIIPRELKIDLKSVKIIENFFIKRKLKKVQFIPKIVQFILKIVQFVRKYVKQ